MSPWYSKHKRKGLSPHASSASSMTPLFNLPKTCNQLLQLSVLNGSMGKPAEFCRLVTGASVKAYLIAITGRVKLAGAVSTI